jgi:hypothetical protein
MAKSLLHDLKVSASSQQPRGVRMSQIMSAP